MKEKLKKDEIGFTQIKNTILQDKSISLKAKGLYGLIYSKPNDWDFSVDRLSRESADEFESTNSAVKELELSGYLERKKRADGKKDWHIHTIPVKTQLGENPSRQKPNLGKTQLGKTRTISNKESSTNKEKKTNKELVPKEKKIEIIDENSPMEKQIAEVMYLFRNLNPVYKTWFNRNPIREKCRELLETFGFKKVKNAIQFSETIISQKYAPTITTPAELFNGWGKLQAYYLKESSNQQQNKGKNYDE